MYNFLGLVNKVNRRLNEAELNQSNFNSAGGWYAQAKESINDALEDINLYQHEWPFNHTSHDEVLNVGQVRYSFPADCKSVDWDSFRIQRDETFGNMTEWLRRISYDEFISKYSDYEYNETAVIRDTPDRVFRTPSNQYGLIAPPDERYTLTYDYYRYHTELENFDDVPLVPEAFEGVILSGAMYYAYMFREDEQAAVLSKEKFDKGLDRMRGILINRYEYAYDTRVNSRSQREFF